MNWKLIALSAAFLSGIAAAILWWRAARMAVPHLDRLSAFVPDKDGKVPAVEYLEKSGFWNCLAAIATGLSVASSTWYNYLTM